MSRPEPHVGDQAPPPPPPPTPVVGVLLPLRIETKFTPPDGTAGWTMRVRVIPDILSVDRHDPLPTEVELDSVEAMWRNCSGDLSSDQGSSEWRAFCTRHGAGRAAWLARTYPPLTTDGVIGINRPTEVRTDALIADLAGLPPTIELWLARGGGPPALAATLTLDPTLLRSDPPDPSSGETRWWSSFPTAVLAGLATTIDLGATADDIDVLYAVGVGGGDPTDLFAAHRDSGELAVLPLGVATNTVDGQPAADLATDPESWRALTLSGGAGDLGTAAVSTVLTGRPDALSPLPGGAAYHLDRAHAMVAALWPGVFGYSLKNLWSIGEASFAAGLWAMDNLVPEGPVPPVRIGDQPYGVLPVTDLREWVVATGDPDVEEQLRPWLLRGLDHWAAAAESAGTTADADTDRLLEVIAQTPSSTHYAWRWFAPLELLHPLSWGFGAGVLHKDLQQWWDHMAAPVLAYPVAPTRRYGSLGYAQDIRMPLVQPNNLTPPVTFAEALQRLATLSPKLFADIGSLKELFPRLPNSLLFRLALFSLMTSAAEVARATVHISAPMLELPYAADTLATQLRTWISTMDPNSLPPHESAQLWQAARGAIAGLGQYDVDDLERTFTATVDTAAYRIDPWVTGIAWRRLQGLAAATYDLGVYGWVDSPAPATAAAAEAEFLHAPSTAQARTAAILRDRALSDEQADRWHMDITSDRVRLADQIAGEVRLGAHLSEVVGRLVERAVAAEADVDRLRAAYPIRTEHAGRRVCDGQRVLADLATDPASLQLATVVLDQLSAIAQALDVYADLLVADAVYDVVSGRTQEASAAMDAAAGLSAPPELDVIRTQRHGRGLATFVLAALPGAAGPAGVDASTSPARIAEPSLAAQLDTTSGPADGDAWTWVVAHPDGTSVQTVTLSDLGLSPADTGSVSGAALARAASWWSGSPAGSTVSPDGELAAHASVLRLIALYGGQPALGSNLADDGSTPDSAPIHADLIARYTDLHDAAEATSAQLQAAATAGASDADRTAALLRALAWGVTPLDQDDPDLATSVLRGRDALAARIAAAPDVLTAGALGVLDLARALTELATGEGRLPILARHRLDQIPAQLLPDVDDSATDTSLQPQWLETVAPVRRTVARLEAYQLGQPDGDALSAWSNSPGDPWRLTAPPPSTTNPAGTSYGTQDTRTLIAAFGPAGVLDAGVDPTREVALALLDSWSETVPATDHPTSVAVHVNTPGSRPPQAILIAVPPDLGTVLDATSTVGIVAAARQLAHARAVTPARIDDLATALPLTMVPANPTAATLLDPA